MNCGSVNKWLWVTHEFKTFIKNTWLISIIGWLITLHWLWCTLAVVCNRRGYCIKKFWCLLIVFVLFCMNWLSFITLKFRLQAHKKNNNNKINLFNNTQKWSTSIYSICIFHILLLLLLNQCCLTIIITKLRFQEPCSCKVFYNISWV